MALRKTFAHIRTIEPKTYVFVNLTLEHAFGIGKFFPNTLQPTVSRSPTTLAPPPNSDDGEREDSDTEAAPHSSPSRKTPPVAPYRDTAAPEPSPPSATVTITTTTMRQPAAAAAAATGTTSPAKATAAAAAPPAPRLIKKVDLGAAANYGKDAQQQQQQGNLMSSPVKPKPPQPAQRSQSDILNDIFDSQSDDNGTGIT